MTRRHFLLTTALSTGGAILSPVLTESSRAADSNMSLQAVDERLAGDWLDRWKQHILGEAQHRPCDLETGEEIGWLISPFLEGFYYGYLATREVQWVERLVDWTDAWIGRGIKEPDGYLGWPKDGTGGQLAKEFVTDSLLGEAMGLRRWY